MPKQKQERLQLRLHRRCTQTGTYVGGNGCLGLSRGAETPKERDSRRTDGGGGRSGGFETRNLNLRSS